MPNFEVFDKRAVPISSEPSVTLQWKGPISFNQAAYLALGKPLYLELLYDKDQKIIGLRPVKQHLPHAYPVRKQGQGNTYVVAGNAFMKHYNIDHKVSVRYAAQMLGDVLAVDLKQEGVEVTKNRTSLAMATQAGSG
jgi:hypothetical protein